MPYHDVLAKVSKETNVPQTGVRAVLQATAVAIQAELNSDAGFSAIPPLGNFRRTVTKARQGRNLKTGEVVQIPEQVRVSFRATSRFKEGLAMPKGGAAAAKPKAKAAPAAK